MTDDDPRRVAIWQLQQTLGREVPAEVAESEPVLVIAGRPEDGTCTVTVRCEPRSVDDEQLWFFIVDESAASIPLMPAERLADAALFICGERLIRELT